MPDSSAFLTTRWTQVLQSRENPGHGPAAAALHDLCAAYYEPVTAFLERSGRSPDQARELSHGFFEWVLERDPFAGVDPERGRFRSYLLGALKHYLQHQKQRALTVRRGGQIDFVPLARQGFCETETGADLPYEDTRALPPDREFDRQWALHILRRALQDLEQGCATGPELERFQLLKPFLSGEAAHGGLAALAANQGWPEATARSHLHRLRRRFRQCIEDRITPTLCGSGETSSEVELLLQALSGA